MMAGNRQGARDKLAKGAIVFLVDPRAPGCPVGFDMGTNGRGSGLTRDGRVDNANDAGQNRLPERDGEDPATNKSRNASTHSVVSCGRDAREM